jgi:chromosome segregation ATPase
MKPHRSAPPPPPAPPSAIHTAYDASPLAVSEIGTPSHHRHQPGGGHAPAYFDNSAEMPPAPPSLSLVDSSFDQNAHANAVQVGILRGRLQGLQHEATSSKRDLKDLSDKLTAVTTKLSEQKVQNSSLTHKYSGALAKLSAAEQSQKQLEDALLSEKRGHAETKDLLEALRRQLSDGEKTMEELQHQLSSKPSVDPAMLHALKDRSQLIPTKEVLDREGQLRRERDQAAEQSLSALDRLLVGQEEAETTLFVCRSAVLSAATDLESRLSHTENVLDALREQMVTYAKEMDVETTRILQSLMTENKELWTQVTKMRFDLDRANSELAARAKRQADSVSKDQHEYTTKQLQLLEEKLKRAQQTMEQQTVAEREHEERMKQLLQQVQSQKQHIDMLERDLAAATKDGDAKAKELDSALVQYNQRGQELSELQAIHLHQTSQLRSLTDQLHAVQETYEVEGRQQLRLLQSERDDALEALQRSRSDLEDALQRLAALERELENRTQYFNVYKSTTEEQNAALSRQLQDELTHSRQIFERELEDLRREVAERTTEYHLVCRELDEERSERNGLRAGQRSLEDETDRLRQELQHQQNLASKLDERANRLAQELEQAKAAQQQAEGRAREASLEAQRALQASGQVQDMLEEERTRHATYVTTIETDWRENDRSRQAMQDEIKRLRQRVGEADQLRQLKDRMEKDKEQLMSENVRLHQQYQDVQQANVQLQQSVTQLKSKLGSSTQLSSQMEDLQRRLAELPSLRQAADEARLEALRAKEEMESLRMERDGMSSRLEFFLEASRSAAKKDSDLDQLFRDASNQVRRLDRQIEEAHSRSGLRMTPSSSSLDGGAAAAGGGRSATRGVTFESPNGRARSPVRPWRI